MRPGINMRPRNENAIKKCELETQKLFELFLKIDETDKSCAQGETNEVNYLVRETDSSVRSGSFGSPPSSESSISSRGGLHDAVKYRDAIEFKRRSLEVPIPSKYGSSPVLSTLQTDSAHSPNSSFSPPSSMAVKMRPHSSGPNSQRTQSGTPTYESFPSETRPRANTGPSEEVLAETAKKIAAIGDEIEADYGSKIENMRSKLESFFAGNNSVSFEVFAAQINDLVGEDRSLNNLALVMQLGKRVIQTTASTTNNLREFYGRFVARAFGEEIARSGSADQYVREHVPSESARAGGTSV